MERVCSKPLLKIKKVNIHHSRPDKFFTKQTFSFAFANADSKSLFKLEGRKTYELTEFELSESRTFEKIRTYSKTTRCHKSR